MKIQIFSVYDSAVGAHLQPFFSRSVGEAIRSFQDACNDAQSQFNKHAMDYTLFLLGTFDDASGVFDCNPPERISSALELRIAEPPSNPATPAPWDVAPKIKIGQR